MVTLFNDVYIYIYMYIYITWSQWVKFKCDFDYFHNNVNMILKVYEHILTLLAISHPVNSCHQRPTDIDGHLSCLLHCEASRLLRKKIVHKNIKCENLNQLIVFYSPYNCVHCVWKELINDLNLRKGFDFWMNLCENHVRSLSYSLHRFSRSLWKI